MVLAQHSAPADETTSVATAHDIDEEHRSGARIPGTTRSAKATRRSGQRAPPGRRSPGAHGRWRHLVDMTTGAAAACPRSTRVSDTPSG